jgi:amidase
MDKMNTTGVYSVLHIVVQTADSMYSAGSWSLLGAKVPRDSKIAANLRAAGAIILGKTNLSQWANYRSSNSSNGWSALGGQVYGAYYPQQDPSGSSSGSGVSSAIGLALACLGTEVSIINFLSKVYADMDRRMAQLYHRPKTAILLVSSPPWD